MNCFPEIKSLTSGADRGNRAPQGDCNHKQTVLDASFKVGLLVHLLVSQQGKKWLLGSEVVTPFALTL